jgi:hypothetical protein
MTIQFDRIYKVSVFHQSASGFVGANPNFFDETGNALEITGMRCQFKIERNLGKEPNTCEITISNLAEKTRAELQRLPMRVRLEAGYVTTGLRLLYVGDVLRDGSYSKPVGPDWETKIVLADGLRAFADARVSKSYGAGVTVRAILRDVARTMSLTLPPEIASDSRLDTPLAVGAYVMGFSSDELARLLARYGYSFSIQNGRLQVLADEQAVAGQDRALDSDNNLIGEPEMGTRPKDGKPAKMKALALIYPEMAPGVSIKLSSRSVNGRFRIIRVGHEGDTHGEKWTTEIEGTPL